VTSLLHSRKFWLAVFGVVQSVVLNYIPDFPQEIWQSINVLIIALIGSIALEDAGLKAGGGTSPSSPIRDRYTPS